MRHFKTKRFELGAVAMAIGITSVVMFSYQACGPVGLSLGDAKIESSSLGGLGATSVQLTLSPQSLTSSRNVRFTFSSPSAHYSHSMCQLDSTEPYRCSSPVEFAGLSDGEHSLTITPFGFDQQAGQPARHVWRIDSTPPSVNITNRPSSLTSSSAAQFVFSTQDAAPGEVRAECSLNNQAFSPCSSPVNYSGLSSQNHNFRVRALDMAGNISQPASYSWRVSTDQPNLNISSAPAALTNSRRATFSFSATTTNGTTISRFNCSLDSQSYATCVSPVTYENLNGGAHVFRVTATDSIGNTSLPVEHSWTIDITAPSVNITERPNNPTNQNNARFSFSGSDNNGPVTFECSMDSQPFSSCSSPLNYPGLLDGTHLFRVQSRDSAGNTSTAQSYSWTLDTILPALQFSEAPASATTSTSASFTFSATDSGSGLAQVQCFLDNRTVSCPSGSYSESNLAIGDHAFRIIALDNAGNENSITHNWTVEELPPPVTVTISSAPESLTNSPSGQFTFSRSDGRTDGFQCSLDQGPFFDCVSPHVTPDLPDGPHEFTVRAVRSSGEAHDSRSHRWTIDTTAPTITFTQAPESATTLTSATFSFDIVDSISGLGSFECSLDSVIVDCAGLSYSFDLLAIGPHVFRVTATDNLANSRTIEHTWTINEPVITDPVEPDPSDPTDPTDPGPSRPRR